MIPPSVRVYPSCKWQTSVLVKKKKKILKISDMQKKLLISIQSNLLVYYLKLSKTNRKNVSQHKNKTR